jgi:hypothetical protein
MTGRPDAIAEALRNRMRVGEGLTAPYARRWAVGGCEATHSLWTYPRDAISDFANGLTELKVPVDTGDDAINIDTASGTIWVGVNGRTRSADRASEFLIGRGNERIPALVINSPEVAIELIRAYSAQPDPIPQTDIVQVGFPGISNDSRTYVGSWQWNVHAEARGDEFVHRAASATLTAIWKTNQRGD